MRPGPSSPPALPAAAAHPEEAAEAAQAKAAEEETRALAARLAAVQSEAISALKMHDSMRSLKEIVRENKGANELPEMMCFGLLESFDLPQIEALIAPRPVLVE